MAIELEIALYIEELRSNFLKYTQKAFGMLPKLEKPKILDVGCGTGVTTIKLAELSNGNVIGIDIDQAALVQLTQKLKDHTLANHIQVLHQSLLKVDFPNESFNIIWAEGVLDIIGYEKILKVCNYLLKGNGFLVLHDQVSRMNLQLKRMYRFSFELTDSFLLPEDAWWVDYYLPLENRVQKLRVKHKDDPQAQIVLNLTQREINMFKENMTIYSAGFYIFQKKEVV